MEQLSTQPGFNVQAGLASFSGKTEKYLALLEKYLQRHSHTAAVIEQSLADGDTPGAQRHAHTLKGAAGILGLAATQQAAAALEQALRNKASADTVAQGIKQLQKVENTQIDALRLALGTQSCLAEPAIAIDPEKLRPIIKSLLALLAEDDMRSAELATLNSAQLQALLGKDYHQLNQLLGNFDFPSALDLLQGALASHPELR